MDHTIKNKYGFLLTTAVLIGCFLGSYYGKKISLPDSPVADSENILSTGTSDRVQLAKASDLASIVVAKDPKNCRAKMALALSLQRRGLTSEAIKQYENLIAEADNFSKLSHYNVGVLYEVLGKFEEAEQHYNLSIARDPSIPIFWANLIKLLLKQNKIDDAKVSVEAALQVIPNAQEIIALKPLVGIK